MHNVYNIFYNYIIYICTSHFCSTIYYLNMELQHKNIINTSNIKIPLHYIPSIVPFSDVADTPRSSYSGIET